MSDNLKIPKHVAIIMDGNGRWAANRHLPKIMGHSKGAEVIRAVSNACIDKGVKYLTLYAFSSENWKRPKEEVDGLMNLLRDYLKKEEKELVKNGIKFMAIGRLSDLSNDIQNGIKNLSEKTSGGDKLVLNLAINYGSRNEIVDAAKNISKDVVAGKVDPDFIDEKYFSSKLYTKDIPDPDIIIRTSGEMRLSNFLLWQSSYSEIYVTAKLWPDFTKEDLSLAIEEYLNRSRRFGG